MLTQLRLRYGLHWKDGQPPIPWTHLRRLLLILGMLTSASSLDYYITRAYYAEQAAAIYSAQAKALHDCEHGATGYYYPDGRAYQCGGKL